MQGATTTEILVANGDSRSSPELLDRLRVGPRHALQGSPWTSCSSRMDTQGVHNVDEHVVAVEFLPDYITLASHSTASGVLKVVSGLSNNSSSLTDNQHIILVLIQ